MDTPVGSVSALPRAAIGRGALLLGLWLALTLGDLSDLPVGIAAAGLATWVSLRLMPPQNARISPGGIAALSVRFFSQSVLAGIDVAVRALNPRLPLKTGFVTYRSHLVDGVALNAFSTMASLLPGTLPASTDRRDAIVIHCLDVDEPVTADMGKDEALFTEAVGARRSHD